MKLVLSKQAIDFSAPDTRDIAETISTSGRQGSFPVKIIDSIGRRHLALPFQTGAVSATVSATVEQLAAVHPNIRPKRWLHIIVVNTRSIADRYVTDST